MKTIILLSSLLFSSNLIAQTLLPPVIVSVLGVSPEHIDIFYIDTNLDEGGYAISYSAVSAEGPFTEEWTGFTNTTAGDTIGTVLKWRVSPINGWISGRISKALVFL